MIFKTCDIILLGLPIWIGLLFTNIYEAKIIASFGIAIYLIIWVDNRFFKEYDALNVSNEVEA